MKNNNNIYTYLLIFSLLALFSGCDLTVQPNEDSTTPADKAISTTYTVTVNKPVLLQKTAALNKIGARAADRLTADNFAVAIVNADGNVVKILPIVNGGVTLNSNGSTTYLFPVNQELMVLSLSI